MDISKLMKTIGFTLAFALCLSAGTANAWKMFSLNSTWPFKDKDKPQEGTPTRIVGAWTDTVMSQPGQKPQRGFGGRLTFYDKEGKKPILVDGQLVVYAFDETGRDPTDNKPTRRYVFPADQMPVHMSMSELGASYSFWLPWDEAGGPKTEIGLICRFEPKGGAVVTGEQTKHLLPGPLPTAMATAAGYRPPKTPEGVPSKQPRQTLEDVKAQRNAEQQARLTSFEAPSVGMQLGAIGNAAQQTGTSPERRMTAATIALPQNYQMPDAAALNSAMQSAGYQSAGQMPQQMTPVAGQVQMQAMPNQMHHMGVAAPPVNQPMNQPMMATQAYMGAQVPQQAAPGAPAYAGVQAFSQTPVGTNPAAGQIQQQAYFQPVQQPASQPSAGRPPQVAPQNWPQMPNQMGTATLNSPATVQYR